MGMAKSIKILNKWIMSQFQKNCVQAVSVPMSMEQDDLLKVS